MLKKGAERLGLMEHWNNSRNCVNCMQCGFCHIGCHYGKVILLEYLDPPYSLFYDVLKIVDENTILGKAFLGKPTFGRHKDGNTTTFKNDYVFGNVLAGTAIVNEEEDHVEMQDSTGGIFHDEIRQVNDDILIGKYYSVRNYLAGFPRDRAFYTSTQPEKVLSSLYPEEGWKRISA